MPGSIGPRGSRGWRDLLARNITLRNPGISVYELNFAVQRTIDRIIFLRISEDRGIEDYGPLLALTNGPHTYQRIAESFRFIVDGAGSFS